MSVTPVTAMLEMPKIKMIDFWNGKREYFHNAQPPQSGVNSTAQQVRMLIGFKFSVLS